MAQDFAPRSLSPRSLSKVPLITRRTLLPTDRSLSGGGCYLHTSGGSFIASTSNRLANPPPNNLSRPAAFRITRTSPPPHWRP